VDREEQLRVKREHMRQWRAGNREADRERNRRWREENPQRRREITARWQAKHQVTRLCTEDGCTAGLTGTRARRCEPHRAQHQARQQKAARDARRQGRTCAVCGTGISDRGVLAKYCVPCKAQHDRETQAARYQDSRAARPGRSCSCGADITTRALTATRCEACQQRHRSGRKRPRPRKTERWCGSCGASIVGCARDRTRCADCDRPPRWCIGCGKVNLAGTPGLRCGPCREAWKAGEAEQALQSQKDWQKANPLKVQFWKRRRAAREKGLDFTVTLEYLSSLYPGSSRCPVCGVTMERGASERQTSPSIERIGNTKGYVPGNVHWCCLGCNGRKSDLTVTELATGRAGPEWMSWARERLGRRSVTGRAA